MKEVESEMLFCNISLWIKSRVTILVVFEANYEIKLLVISSGKKGDNTIILKLQNILFGYYFSTIKKKWMSHFFLEHLNECWEKPYHVHLHQNSPSHLFIPRTR